MNQNDYYVGPKRNWLPAGTRELVYAAVSLLLGLFSANMFFFGGLNLGFAIAAAAVLIACRVYLFRAGYRGDRYSDALLALSLVIAAGFGRSGDYVVKFILVQFLLVAGHLSLCLTAGKNNLSPGGIGTVLDALDTIVSMGFGKMPRALRGIAMVFRSGGETARRSGAVLAGLAIAVPALAVMVPLLMASDAAFEGLIDLLPDFDLAEIFLTAIFGTGCAIYLYALGAGLHMGEKPATPVRERKTLNPLTVNTALGAVCLLYGVYLLSQLAYLSGGFAGILPQGYTAAEYARRGFFEMAWLCAINLGIIAFGVGLSARRAGATRLLCAFLAAVTLFLVAASCAKMLLYIDLYGLTRLRVLTMVVTVFLAAATVLVGVWLFLPKLQYMKVLMLLGLSLGAAVLWLDVDTQVAKYNVEHYLSGDLATVDVHHLGSLGGGAVPYIEQLLDCGDPETAQTAKDLLTDWFVAGAEDFRSYNRIDDLASGILEQYQPPEAAEETDFPEDHP